MLLDALEQGYEGQALVSLVGEWLRLIRWMAGLGLLDPLSYRAYQEHTRLWLQERVSLGRAFQRLLEER